MLFRYANIQDKNELSQKRNRTAGAFDKFIYKCLFAYNILIFKQDNQHGAKDHDY